MRSFLRNHGKQIRFLMAGAVSTFTGTALIFSFQYLFVDTLPPQVIFIMAAAINSPFAYGIMKRFVFRTPGNYLKEYVRYCVSLATVCLVGAIFLSLFVDVLKMNVYAAQAVNLAVTGVSAYALLSFFAFARARADTQRRND